jgi:hypothetical protein
MALNSGLAGARSIYPNIRTSQLATLIMMQDYSTIRCAEIQKLTGYDRRVQYAQFVRLLKQGLIERHYGGRYALTDRGREACRLFLACVGASVNAFRLEFLRSLKDENM